MEPMEEEAPGIIQQDGYTGLERTKKRVKKFEKDHFLPENLPYTIEEVYFKKDVESKKFIHFWKQVTKKKSNINKSGSSKQLLKYSLGKVIINQIQLLHILGNTPLNTLT